jgi:SPX domain protein involved in polyphosphate accumulation
MTTIYQLLAKGESLNGYRFQMKSKKVFKTIALAEAHKQDFFIKCTDDNNFECADPETLEVKIIELELVG